MTHTNPPPAGRLIRMFLVNGTPTGIVVAEIGNWVGKVLSAPRPRLSELLHRPECGRTGIYLMIGADPDRPGGRMAYIGEADNVAARMRYHLTAGDQDFFDRAAVVVASDDNLTKSHVRYLESRLIRSAKTASAVRLANTREPDFRRLPEADRAEMDTFFMQMRTVLPLIGYDIFGTEARSDLDSVARTSDKSQPIGPVFRFDPGGAAARAIETGAGFVVLKGSTARRGESPTFPTGYRNLRDNLIADGAILDQPDVFCFSRDVVFTSPSAAAAIIAGRSASGPGEWKTEAGETYREVKALELQSVL